MNIKFVAVESVPIEIVYKAMCFYIVNAFSITKFLNFNFYKFLKTWKRFYIYALDDGKVVDR